MVALTPMANAMDRLKALERSLGGPSGAPLLIGCDEPPADVAAALECVEPDVEYRFCVRVFQGADTYIITARAPTEAELADLEALMAETVPESDGSGDEDEDGEGDDD